MRLIAFLLLFLFVCGPATARLSPVEQDVVDIVASEQERTINFLERMVNQNSGTLNLAGVEAVAEMVRAELAPLGFDVKWVDMRETNRAGHLIATFRNGSPAPDERGPILLIGHLDTVFEPDSPFQLFEREGNRATGPGIGDDKGGIAVIVAALRALHSTGELARMNVTIVLTGDEERPGSPLGLARNDLIEAGREAAFALEFENLARSSGTDHGTSARRSSTSWTLTTSGRTGHSSGIFSEGLGHGAIYELARILDRFRTELREPNLTFNVGVIGGGTPAEMDSQGLRISASGKTNIIAETAIARGDLRALSAEQDRKARARMEAIVADHLPLTQAELRFAEDGYPPMAPTDGNRALLARLNEVNRDLGLAEMPEYDPARRGAADSSFVAEHVDVLAGMGAAGGGAHAVGEWIDLDSLVRQAQRTALLIRRLAGLD